MIELESGHPLIKKLVVRSRAKGIAYHKLEHPWWGVVAYKFSKELYDAAVKEANAQG